jgi:8-amino-7-oxononanoate synthase
MLPKKLQNKLDKRIADNALRHLNEQPHLVDFSSNDYLGFSKSEGIFKAANTLLKQYNSIQNGATGSRLLSGNYNLYAIVEQELCEFHNSEAALIFNSGYDANIGFFSSVPQRGDIILYDEFIHASIRDGITMSNAKAHKFKHNNLEDLEQKCKNINAQHRKDASIYIVTESVFSMDGDTPDLHLLTMLSKQYNAFLVVDEAHAVGVFGENGEGLIQREKLEHNVFARIITFGKAMGCHGAAIICNKPLQQYLVNFCRPFIYTTALPPHSIATIKAAYQTNKTSNKRNELRSSIKTFKLALKNQKLNTYFIDSNSAIQCCIISGNANVKAIALALQKQGFDVKPILSPTVPIGKERLRFCLHAYNTHQEISNVLKALRALIPHERYV